MTITAAHLRELNVLGIVGDTLIRVVEIIEEASALSADKSADVRRGPLESTASSARKERDKQRKRLVRAAEKAAKLSAKTSADSPVLSADNAIVAPTYFLPSLPSSEEPLKKSKRDGLRARGTRLSVGAPLTEEFIDAAIEAGASRAAAPKMWIEFVDYWSDIPGQRGCKVSWLGTWRNNVKRIGNGNWNGQKNGRRTVHDAAKDLHENILARVLAFDEPAPSSLCGGEGTDAVRLLPPGRRE